MMIGGALASAPNSANDQGVLRWSLPQPEPQPEPNNLEAVVAEQRAELAELREQIRRLESTSLSSDDDDL